ncbi:hypothetical protein [Planotetraspora sp. GP83]|uniref:hypothetical protein n=1 Tax=Planotetraspora sp. GP83 TaxID=3156264 RepID=UPI003517A0C0
MVEAGEVSNPDFEKRYGFALKAKGREHLNDLKLIESSKKGRALAHVLTDRGWARAAEEFRAEIAAPTGAAGAIIRALNVGLQGFLDRTDQTLADVLFAPPEDSDSAPSPEPVGMPFAPSAARSAMSVAESDLESRIRAVYAQLAEKPGAWVSLTELRPLLGGATRTEVDHELSRMNHMPDVNIVPESNQKDLSAKDRDAAVVIGDQQKHHLSIGA